MIACCRAREQAGSCTLVPESIVTLLFVPFLFFATLVGSKGPSNQRKGPRVSETQTLHALLSCTKARSPSRATHKSFHVSVLPSIPVSLFSALPFPTLLLSADISTDIRFHLVYDVLTEKSPFSHKNLHPHQNTFSTQTNVLPYQRHYTLTGLIGTEKWREDLFYP